MVTTERRKNRYTKTVLFLIGTVVKKRISKPTEKKVSRLQTYLSLVVDVKVFCINESIALESTL